MRKIEGYNKVTETLEKVFDNDYGKSVDFQLDTGTSCNVIGFGNFSHIVKN